MTQAVWFSFQCFLPAASTPVSQASAVKRCNLDLLNTLHTYWACCCSVCLLSIFWINENWLVWKMMSCHVHTQNMKCFKGAGSVEGYCMLTLMCFYLMHRDVKTRTIVICLCFMNKSAEEKSFLQPTEYLMSQESRVSPYAKCQGQPAETPSCR